MQLGTDGSVERFTRRSLLSVKRRLIRRGAWFTGLNHTERGIVDLSIMCVEEVRSRALTRTLNRMLAKVSDALKSRFLERVERVGVPLARKISGWAISWGNLHAYTWAEDPAFTRYLALNVDRSRGMLLFV